MGWGCLIPPAPLKRGTAPAHGRYKIGNPPMPKGTAAANLLSISCAFKCIVNAFFCCLDTY